MSATLSSRLGRLQLPSPIVVAAGCGGTGRELRPYAELAALGAFTTASVTLEPRQPRTALAESPSGLITSVRRPSTGVDAFLERDLPWLSARGVRVIVSITGREPAEFTEIARRLATAAAGISAIEVDLGSVGQLAERVVREVRAELPAEVVVLAKLAAGLGGLTRMGGLVEVAGAAAAGGADGVTLSGGVPGMAIDPGTLRPALDGPGLLSGSAVHPVAVQAVYEVHAAYPELAIVGTGGVSSGWDALELVLAGASAVGVGSALLRDPAAASRITAELADALETCRLASVAAAVGIAHRGGRPAAAQPGQAAQAAGATTTDDRHWEAVR